MKSLYTILISVITSILIGTLFMDVSSTEEQEVISTNQEIVAFQIGAYKTLENATKISDLYDGIVIKEEEHFTVYVAILSNQINIDRMINHLNELNVYYFLKKIETPYLYKDELYKYEELMKKTTSDVAYLKLIQQSLKKYKEYYENQGSTS